MVPLICILFSSFMTAQMTQSETALRVGDPAPEFTLPYATREKIVREGMNLRETTNNGPVILAFYPADWSGGCTKEMCTMRDDFAYFTGLGVAVLGISGDYMYSHHEWAKHHNLPFALLSDHDHAVARAYLSYNEETGYNRRTVYVVDTTGTIAYIDLAYRVDTPESFEKLKTALTSIK